MGRRVDIKPLPPCEELHRLFSYDAETGELLWRIRPSNRAVRVHPGDAAGTIGEKGYLVVGIARAYFLAHRLIWKMVTGCDPEDQIDHRDLNRANNRWINLRPASNGPNLANSKLRRDNKSGVKGVCWEESHKAWSAQIAVHGKQRRIGRFKDFDAAQTAITKERLRLHGEFARFK